MRQRDGIKYIYIGAKVGFLGMLLATLFLLPNLITAKAAPTTQSISISPTSANPTIDPGASTTGNIQIFNQGSDSYNYTVSVTPYGVSSENYDPSFTPVAGHPIITSWFTFDSLKGHLSGGDNNTISYKVSVPSGTLPGSYYAVVFAETQPEPISGNGILAQKRVGTIFYITVSGKAVNSAKVASFDVALYQKPPLEVVLRVENDGSVYQIANYHIVMKNLLTGKSTTFNDSRYVLQQTIRRIPVTWSRGPSLGLFKVSGTVSFSNQTVNLPPHYSFVSSILNLIILVALVLLVIAIIVVLLLKRNRKRKNAPKRT